MEEDANDVKAGHCAAMAALVIALNEAGVLPNHGYRDVLHSLWLEMPEQQAVGEAGAVVERVLELVDTGVGAPYPSDDADRKREIATTTARPSPDHPMTEPVRAATKARLDAFFRRGRLLLSA